MDDLGAGATLVDFHIRRCHSIGSGGGSLVGGIAKFGGATTFRMIRGSISGCSGRQVGGALVTDTPNSFIDVLINDCHVFGTTEYDSTGIPILIGGGGVCIQKGTLIMSGGAIRNCHAPHGFGGGIRSEDGGVQMELSGVIVQGCTAEYGGGVYLEENTDARLTDVRIDDCEIARRRDGRVTVPQVCEHAAARIDAHELGAAGHGAVAAVRVAHPRQPVECGRRVGCGGRWRQGR